LTRRPAAKEKISGLLADKLFRKYELKCASWRWHGSWERLDRQAARAQKEKERKATDLLYGIKTTRPKIINRMLCQFLYH
jgi:hypothetical protein